VRRTTLPFWSANRSIGNSTPLRPGYREDFGYSVEDDAPSNLMTSMGLPLDERMSASLREIKNVSVTGAGLKQGMKVEFHLGPKQSVDLTFNDSSGTPRTMSINGAS
jgi:hypothetical protein